MVANLWGRSSPFYKNKTIRIVVGLSPGGGYDRAARLVSRYIGNTSREPPMMLVQTIYELMDEYKTPAISRQVAEAMMASGEWARALLARPGTPLERAKISREAYEKALHDPDLIAEARKGRVEVKFARGDELEALVRKVMEQQPEVIARIRQLFV